ncbi:MAG: GNAT family N-acetyltransferase [Desulfitobacterium sp.]|nr:GNAT family N-acetyltransferase [Desulfitobacterium sp.]
MLQGKKTYLRPLENDDIVLFKKWYNDQEVNYWANGAWPLTTMLGEEEIEERFFLTQDSSDRYIVLNEKKTPIGTIGFRELNLPARSATLFIIIGEKEYWGQGYGTDALRVLIDYLFLQWNLHRLTVDTWDGNHRAIRAYEKLGFKVEGCLRQARFVQGEYRDAIIMGILRNEYESLFNRM